MCKLPEASSIPGLRTMVKKDATQVHELMMEYIKKFQVHPVLSLAEIKHIFLHKEEIVNVYVVENEEKKITDFV